MSNTYTPDNPSAAAIARVRSPLPVPTVCPLCGSSVVLKHHNEVLGYTIPNRYPWFYVCTTCDARVSLHTNTYIPIGYLANRELRIERMNLKNSFKHLYSGDDCPFCSRGAAYSWLAQMMRLHPKNCHIGHFNLAQCKQAKEFISLLIKDSKDE